MSKTEILKGKRWGKSEHLDQAWGHCREQKNDRGSPPPTKVTRNPVSFPRPNRTVVCPGDLLEAAIEYT